MLSFLGSLLSAAVAPITSVVDGWQARATARTEAAVATIKAKAEAEATIMTAKATSAVKMAEQGQQADIDWDNVAVSQMEHSWKDEWFTVLFSVPLVMAFIPTLAPFVIAGFKALEGVPVWYSAGLGTAVAASFGVRKIIPIFTGGK